MFERSVNQRVDAVNLRIGDLRGEVQSLRQLIYIVIAGILALIGFVIWDRRTALSPAIRKNKELEERQERLERVFKELARRDSSIAEILKNVGLL